MVNSFGIMCLIQERNSYVRTILFKFLDSCSLYAALILITGNSIFEAAHPGKGFIITLAQLNEALSTSGG